MARGCGVWAAGLAWAADGGGWAAGLAWAAGAGWAGGGVCHPGGRSSGCHVEGSTPGGISAGPDKAGPHAVLGVRSGMGQGQGGGGAVANWQWEAAGQREGRLWSQGPPRQGKADAVRGGQPALHRANQEKKTAPAG